MSDNRTDIPTLVQRACTLQGDGEGGEVKDLNVAQMTTATVAVLRALNRLPASEALRLIERSGNQ